MCLDVSRNRLTLQSGCKLCKELTGQVSGVGRVGRILAAKIVVEDSSIDGLMNMGKSKIHMVTFDGAGHATDEDNGAIRLLPFHDSDVRQHVVHFTIPVVVPRVVEEDEIAWVGEGTLVERALLAYVCMDQTDTIGVGIVRTTAIEIDAVFEENRTGDSGTIIGDTAAVHVDGAGSNKLSCGTDDGGTSRCAFQSLAAGLVIQGKRWLRTISGDAGAADQCGDRNDESD